LIIVGLANLSGWVGGAIGPGQLREAVSAAVYKLKIIGDDANLSSLVDTIQRAVNVVIPLESNGNRFLDLKPNMVIVQGQHKFSIMSYKHVLEWRKVIKPQALALRWAFDEYEYSTNMIIDNVFNLFRARVTKIILFSKQASTQRHSMTLRPFYVIVLNYKETPAIIWVDPEVEEASRAVCEQISKAFRNADELKAHTDWEICSLIKTSVRKWFPKITLEQISKNTIGANIPYEIIKEDKIDQENNISADVLEEILGTPTVFDKFRGKAFAFISFMFFQIFIGIGINLFSAQLLQLK
jgi:hypothetical protein